MPRRRRGFTLVELLVVIGVIAVLLALLLPALARAREQANRLQCLATLRNMAGAAHLHASEHQGYMPIAGQQSPLHLGVAATPQGLNDRAKLKYMYYWHPGGLERPLPLPAALINYMSLKVSGMDGAAFGPLVDNLERDPAVRRVFTCPSHDADNVRAGWVLGEGAGGPISPEAYMSYVFNDAVLARKVFLWGETPAGKLSRIRRPSEVFLFADGNPHNDRTLVGYDIFMGEGSQDQTLLSYWNRQFNSGQFDHVRHRNLMNVVFVDGHAETIQMPRANILSEANKGDFERIGFVKGIYH